jgi:hypothetical protein
MRYQTLAAVYSSGGETKSRQNSDLDDVRICLSDNLLNLEPEKPGLSSCISEDKFLTEFDFFFFLDR